MFWLVLILLSVLVPVTALSIYLLLSPKTRAVRQDNPGASLVHLAITIILISWSAIAALYVGQNYPY